MPKAFRLLVPLAAALALGTALLAAGPAAGHGPAARAASTTCAKHGKHGYRYLYYLHAGGGATCAGAREVADGYLSCLKHGHSVCTTHHYTCHRRILDKGLTNYDARVLCHRGSKAVAFKYNRHT